MPLHTPNFGLYSRFTMLPPFLNRHRILFSAFVLLLGLVWIAVSAQGQIFPNSNPAPRPGFLAPDFNLKNLNGEDIHLTDFRGQPVLLNFWATWCPPCRAEMPAFQKVFTEYSAQGLVILAVNSQESDSTAAAFADSYSLTFPILLDEDGHVSSRYRVDALPTTIFINRDGTISQVMYGGPISEAVLHIQIEKILAENP